MGNRRFGGDNDDYAGRGFANDRDQFDGGANRGGGSFGGGRREDRGYDFGGNNDDGPSSRDTRENDRSAEITFCL